MFFHDHKGIVHRKFENICEIRPKHHSVGKREHVTQAVQVRDNQVEIWELGRMS